MASILMAAAIPALADIAPVISWQVDSTEQNPYPLRLRRGETVILQPTYNQDLTGTHTVLLKTRASGAPLPSCITGSVYSATGGVARIRFDVTLATGIYQYEVSLISSNATNLRGNGPLTVVDSMSGDTTTTPPSGTGDTLAPSEPEGNYPNDIAPVISWETTPGKLTPYPHTINQGETVILRPRLLASDLSGVAAVALRYRPTGSSGWHYVAPGTVHNATNGEIQVRWDSSIEGTNSTYQYEIALQSSSAFVLGAIGTITRRPSLSGSSTSMPTRVTTFDWATVDHVNIGGAPFLSQVALAPFASFWGSLTNGLADLNVRSLLVDGQPIGTGGVGRGTGSYTNTEIAGVSHTNGVRIADGSNTTWRLRGGAWRVDVPVVVGPQGPPGTAVTNITIQIVTNLNQTIMTMTVTNITIGGGGAGNYTNTAINGVANTNGIRIGDSVNSTWTLGTDGVWRVDMSTNQTQWVINGEHIGGVDSNGITLLKGTLQLYEEDLDCNVRLYDGSRLVPSLTFKGHPGEWGLYARGYGGHYVAGWSVASNEVGLLHAGGVRLMDTNAAFEGRLIGDLSQATGYPEPVFEAWKTNMQFSYLSISNLVVTPGKIEVRDINATTRAEHDSSGTIALKSAGGIRRTLHAPGSATFYGALGAQGSIITDTTLSFLDQVSGMTTISLGNGALAFYSLGTLLFSFDYWNGIQHKNESSGLVQAQLNYRGLWMSSSAGTPVFTVDNVGQTTIIASCIITNNGSITMLGNGPTNLITLSGQSGNIKALGTSVFGGITTTNGGNVSLYSTQGSNLVSLVASNGSVRVRGEDSDARYIRATYGWSGVVTNIAGVKTNLSYYWTGIVTNVVYL